MAAPGLRGQQFDHRLLMPGGSARRCLRQFHGAVGSEDGWDRGRDRGARRRPVVDPRDIGIRPETPIASVSEDMAPVTEHRSRPVGGVKDQLSVDLPAGDRDLDGRPLTDEADRTRRW